MTTIFDRTAISGGNIHSNTQFLGAFFRFPTVKGRRYRFWIDLLQSAMAVGPAIAVSNCSVKIGPNYPPGSPLDPLYGNSVRWSYDDWIWIVHNPNGSRAIAALNSAGRSYARSSGSKA
jgi:hypothetical protein